ncbi:hypothetical protein M9Y10_026331 [Tritrichomonas musculus]|uniref:Uncharacterized protein n=1 Tax=Tritrichomonas musculus TaxID=1915356 RepID=A0ABR2H7C8_9EUKA
MNNCNYIIYKQQVKANEFEDLLVQCKDIEIDLDSQFQVNEKVNTEYVTNSTENNIKGQDTDRGDISELFLFIPNMHI